MCIHSLVVQHVEHVPIRFNANFSENRKARQNNKIRKTLRASSNLEGVDVAETVLDVTVDDELRQAQHLATQVERVAETRLLPLLPHTHRHRELSSRSGKRHRYFNSFLPFNLMLFKNHCRRLSQAWCHIF